MAVINWPMIWNARWVWAAPAPKSASPLSATPIPPRETWNRFCYLRRAFELDAAAAAVPARVTADSRYVLYVNGVEVARGPARSTPERLSYAELDLAPHLRRGKNVIAALVRFYGAPIPWWRPALPSLHLGMGSFAFEAPAIGIASGSSWKGRSAPYRPKLAGRRGLSMPPVEILDGAEIPAGWTEPDFDDSTWEPAVELSAGTLAQNRLRIPVEPYTAMELDDIAPLTAISIELDELNRRKVPEIAADQPGDAYPTEDASATGPDTLMTYDAGGTTLATPWVAVSGPKGATVDIYAGEDLRGDRSAEIAPRFYSMRYVLSGDGGERVDAYEAVGFRYLSVVARGGAEVRAAGAIERRYPRSGDAGFECDDLALNKIWSVGARTLELCSTDAFIDCPGREQRAWLGDSYIHALLTYVTNTDWRLVRRHLRICAHSQRPDGLLGMIAAGDIAVASTTIPDYSLHWVRALARYFEYSGDADTVRELAPAAVAIFAAFERYRAADGLIRGMPGWTFIDWAMTERAEATAAMDALYAAALDDFAAVAETALGEPRLAAGARARAARTRAAFETYWDEQRGVYVDAADARGALRRVSQQTNAIAIVGGCAPRERWARMLGYVLGEDRVVITPTISDNLTAYISQRMNPAEYVEFSAERNVVAAQPFFSHLVHDAIVRAGRRDLIAARCMKWWPQIERGDTVFEEYWDARAGTGSRCHAWSATPTYDLTTHVLGVRPTAPGYAKARIAPRFGPLKHLEGRVPTPRGMIAVSLDRERGGEIVLPDGVAAEVSFEDAPLTGGALGAGRHKIDRA